MVLNSMESPEHMRSVVLFMAPSGHEALGRLVNLVAEELQSPILVLPGFDWAAFECPLDLILLHERFQCAVMDLADYDHIALATSVDEYPLDRHSRWLQQLCARHAFVLSALAGKHLSLVTVGKSALRQSSPFQGLFEQTVQMLDMHFLGGVHVPCPERFRYARAVDPVISYIDIVQSFNVTA
jgi:hypothetical protein